MSSIPDADEVCLLAHNPYDAGQRALWHLEKIGSIIDCMYSKSAPSFGNDLSLVYAVPRIIKSVSESHFLPHSTSVEEFGMFGDSLSPRAGTPRTTSAHPVRFLRVTEKTRVKFLNPNSVAVFSLDLSPSMNVIDTSFKSISTGCHLVENLVNTLSLSFRCLLNRTRISVPGADELPFPYQPNLYVTVIAHGIPESGVVPLVVGEALTNDTLDEILGRISICVREAINDLSRWLILHHANEQLNGSVSCSRTRTPCTSLVCTANDVSSVVRDGLTAISMTCAQLGLSKAGVNKSLMVVTDGVLAHPRKLPYDNILMHLNFIDVAMHIVQVGGGFAPWSALGYSSDPDLLRLLAASTPTGLFLQDHHLDPILSGSVQPEGRGIYGPTPNLNANVLAKALLLKFSSLTTNLRRKRSHMPFRSLSYQSSLLVKDGGGKGDASNSYIDHIQGSRLSRSHDTVMIQGIAEMDAPQRSMSSSMGFSPIARNRVTSADSMATSLGEFGELESDLSSEETTPGQSTSAIQSLKSYLEPEKTKAARPYLYKQYKLPGVSVAQIIQTRAREGFLIEASSTTAGASRRLSTSTSSPQLKRTNSSMLKTSSSNSSLVTTVSEPKRSEQSVSLSMNWGPTMDIIYELSTSAIGGDESSGASTTPGELFVSRPCEEVRIKIYLRMQSGEFFLRFKQQLSSSANHDTYFGQMCKQLDAFIDAIFQVDDVLAKLTSRPPRKPEVRMRRQQSQEIGGSRTHSLNKISEEADITIAQSHSMDSLISETTPSPPYTPRVSCTPPKEVVPKNVAHWHRWFTVRNLFVLNEIEASKGRVRHGMMAPLLVAGREGLIQAIREFSHEEFDSKFLINVSKLYGMELLMTNSHVSNILCRSNDVLVSRLLGDSRGGTVTDTINPFVVIDVGVSNEAPHGVLVLTLGLFGMCPSMEKKFVDIFSNHIGERSILLDAPSPIFRSIAAGLLRAGVHVKKQPVARTNTVVVPTTTVGMGAGESFYTYSPEPSMVNKFMIYHAWETVCSSAIVPTDLLTKIHEERIKNGWKCIHESQNALTYVEFTDRGIATEVQVAATPTANELTRLWVPAANERISKSPRASAVKSTCNNLIVNWGDEMTDKKRTTEAYARRSVKAMCTCLHVHYVQPRAEKPFLKCQIWMDRGHPVWKTSGMDNFKQFAHSLCEFE